MNSTQLDRLIQQASIPIYGVADLGGSYRIDFQAEATEAQRQQAEAIAANFVPVPTDDPNWDNFIDQMPLEVLGAIAQSPMAALITARMARLAIAPQDWKGAEDRLLNAWNVAPPQLSAEQRSELAALASSCQVPLAIDGQNRLKATA